MSPRFARGGRAGEPAWPRHDRIRALYRAGLESLGARTTTEVFRLVAARMSRFGLQVHVLEWRGRHLVAVQQPSRR